jgi:hypothetical protein
MNMKSKGTTMIALFTAILVCVAGCTASRERQAFPGGTGSSTQLPVSTFDKSASDCYITIMGYGGVKIYITDPGSRYLGIALDSEAAVNEIPGADYQIDPNWGYDASQGDSTAQPVKLVTAHIPDPVEGLYLVQVHGTLDTQGGGLSVSARCSGKAETMRMVNIDHAQELPVEYQFTYSLQNQELITELAAGGQ